MSLYSIQTKIHNLFRPALIAPQCRNFTFKHIPFLLVVVVICFILLLASLSIDEEYLVLAYDIITNNKKNDTRYDTKEWNATFDFVFRFQFDFLCVSSTDNAVFFQATVAQNENKQINSMILRAFFEV